jgi:hypothetical protein
LYLGLGSGINDKKTRTNYENLVITEVKKLILLEKNLDPEKDILIKSIENVEWPNACLGAEEGGELCIRVITPGFKLVTEVGSEEFIYHTNNNGSVIRLVVVEGL